MSGPLVTAIILCHNQMKSTIDCMNAVRNSTVECKLILVDNGSSDGTSEWLHKAAFDDEKIDWFIPLSENQFLGPAWNKALDAIGKFAPDTDYVGKVDNDYYFHPGWYENLLGVIEATDPDMVIVSGDGILQQEQRDYPQYRAEMNGVHYMQGPPNDQGGSYYMKYSFLKEHNIRMKQRKHMTNFTNGHMVEEFNAHGGKIVRLAKPYLTREFERYADPELRAYYIETFKARNRMNDLTTWMLHETRMKRQGKDERGDKPFKIGGCYE